MAERCNSCSSCGMQFTRPEDHALNDVYNEYCKDCTNPDGSLKSYKEILVLMTESFERSQGIDRTAAEEMARQIMDKLPAWSGRESDCG